MRPPPPISTLFPYTTLFRSGKKVSVNDTDHLWGHGGTVSWAWKSFVRGHNTLLMDSWDPIAGSPCPEVNWGPRPGYPLRDLDRKSTRLNSSHTVISYAVFCLNETATTDIYTLSLHDALPIWQKSQRE